MISMLVPRNKTWSEAVRSCGHVDLASTPAPATRPGPNLTACDAPIQHVATSRDQGVVAEYSDAVMWVGIGRYDPNADQERRRKVKQSTRAPFS